MGASTGIALAATSISFANEWVVTDQLNWRVPVAGLGVALFLDGIEQISPQAAVGLAWMFMITILVAPFGGSSPAETVAGLLAQQPKTPTPTGQ